MEGTDPERYLVDQFLSLYFAHGRPPGFTELLPDIISKYKAVIQRSESDYIISRASLLYLCAYRLGTYDYDAQKHLAEQILSPYQEAVQRDRRSPALITPFEAKAKSVVIVLRHAHESGSYAPGGYMCAMASAFVDLGYDTTIIVLEEISDSFARRMAGAPNCRMTSLKKLSERPSHQATEIASEVSSQRPLAVITEVPVGPTSVVSILNPWLPVLYCSLGHL